MAKRISREKLLLDTAKLNALRSTCGRKKVGAVIARGGRVISTGYNDAPSGRPHCSEDLCDMSKPCTRTIHAEHNAILFAAREGIQTGGADLYVTMLPCGTCAKAIIQAGIKNVYYEETYRDTSSIKELEESGINVKQLCWDTKI